MKSDVRTLRCRSHQSLTQDPKRMGIPEKWDRGWGRSEFSQNEPSMKRWKIEWDRLDSALGCVSPTREVGSRQCFSQQIRVNWKEKHTLCKRVRRYSQVVGACVRPS
jgi:hypothetical protein